MTAVTVYSSDYCPFCTRAKQLLDQKGIDYKEIIVDGKPELRQEAMQKSGQRTVPQIWIGDTHVGGCDDLWNLHSRNQLDTLLTQHSIN